MSACVYVLPKGGTDPQKPHREDEMYYVIRGRARMQIGSDHAEVRAGSVISSRRNGSIGSTTSRRNWKSSFSLRLPSRNRKVSGVISPVSENLARTAFPET